jgi:hypothetical protein
VGDIEQRQAIVEAFFKSTELRQILQVRKARDVVFFQETELMWVHILQGRTPETFSRPIAHCETISKADSPSSGCCSILSSRHSAAQPH